MKVVKINILIFYLVLMIAAPSAFGQNNKTDFAPYWELNLNGGLNIFFGDLKQNTIIPSNTAPGEWKYGGGLMFVRQHSPVFGFRMQLLAGELLGTKKEINRFFESNYYEANINATIDLNNLFGDYKANRKLNFYLVSGVGLTNYNSTLREISTAKALRYRGFGNGRGIGGRTLEGVLLAGVGAKFKINNKLSLNLESVSRVMNSDMMDMYEDANKYDFYNYTSIGISYSFLKARKKSHTLISPVIKPEIVEQKSPEANNKVIPEVEEKIIEKPIIKPEVIVETIEKEKPIIEPEVIVETIEKEKPVILETTINPALEYSVQIRANYEKRLSKMALSNTYNIPFNHINESMHNNYYIYTVGSFRTYDEAKEFRTKLRSENRVYDAFIVAFSYGKRMSKLP